MLSGKSAIGATSASSWSAGIVVLCSCGLTEGRCLALAIGVTATTTATHVNSASQRTAQAAEDDLVFIATLLLHSLLVAINAVTGSSVVLPAAHTRARICDCEGNRIEKKGCRELSKLTVLRARLRLGSRPFSRRYFKLAASHARALVVGLHLNIRW